MKCQKIKRLVFVSLCFSLAYSGLYQFPASGQQMLKGLISSTWYQVAVSNSGQQFYVNEAGQQVFLPGNGVAAGKVQIYAGPLGNHFYIDKTGARVPIPPSNTQAPSASYGSTTQAPVQYGSSPSYPSVNAPYVPINVYPTGYPAYNYGAPGQPVNINATGTVNYPATTSGTTTGTTTSSTSGSSTGSGGTVSTSGEGTVTTPTGQYSVEHSGQTTVTPTSSGTTSNGQSATASESQSASRSQSSMPSSFPAQPPSTGASYRSPAQGWMERSNGPLGGRAQTGGGFGSDRIEHIGEGLFPSQGISNGVGAAQGRGLFGGQGIGAQGGAFSGLGGLSRGSAGDAMSRFGANRSHGLQNGLSHNLGGHALGAGRGQHKGGGMPHGHRRGRR